MIIVPISMNFVNWKTYIPAVKQEQGKDVTANLDRAGIPLHLPTSFVSSFAQLRLDETMPAYSELYLQHLHFGFYYSLDAETVLRLSCLSDLAVSDFDGCGIVSGNFLQWKNFIANVINLDPQVALGFYKWFERAGLDRYFHRDTKDDIRKKSQIAGR